MTITVRPLRLEDADTCDEIVLSLPYHFAIEEGRRLCADAVRAQPGIVAEEDGVVLGFLTFEPRFEMSAEITWVAVRADRRRAGIGGMLVDRLATDLRSEGRRLLLVLTVSPSDGPDDVPDGYQATRAFYERHDFVLARDIPELWESDTAVLMVRPLGPAA
jgi:ribosomal protein S18 acetylase RimI-like enzyme